MFRRRRRYDSQQVAEHLRTHLGAPFAVMDEEVVRGAIVNVHGFLDVPAPDQVTLVTVGLSAYFRDIGCAAGHVGAEEVMLVVGKHWFGERLLDFFMRCVAVHATVREPLDLDEPIRLSSPVPGAPAMRYLLPTPAAVFSEDFPVVEETTGLTVLWMLVPVHTVEAEFVADHGWQALHEVFADQDVDVTDLDRRPCVPAAR